MEIKHLKSKDELTQGFGLISELRPHLTLERFLWLTGEASRCDGYTVVAAFEHGTCVGVMGYRVLYDLVHGKHLYVDDLIVSAERRSTGLGARLLEHAEKEAAAHGCEGLRLCTGTANTRAIAFYERNGWQARAVALKKPADTTHR